MSPELKQFIQDNKDLINQNTKESWEKIFKLLKERFVSVCRAPLVGKFTQIILDADINDPAKIMGYIPEYYLCSSNINYYKISSSMSSIGGSAFEYCNDLTWVIIEDGVVTIEDRAFKDCHNLINMKIPNSVTSIGALAFMGCSSLTNMVIPNSVITIGEYAFKNCSNLKKNLFLGY